MRKMLSILATVAVLGSAMNLFAQDPTAPTPTTPQETKDIASTVSADTQFKTFYRLVKLAGLDTKLAAKPVDVTTTTPPDTFTVLAPTDEAFAKLPAGALEQLEKQPEVLKKVLQYHIVKGTLNQADLKDGDKLTTLEEETIEVKVTDGKPKLGIAAISKADIKAKNGVIQAIDTVLVPPSLLKKEGQGM